MPLVEGVKAIVMRTKVIFYGLVILSFFGACALAETRQVATKWPDGQKKLVYSLNAQGKKLSKRDADTNMLAYRDKGYPAAAVFNYIALLGWGFSAEKKWFFWRDLCLLS